MGFDVANWKVAESCYVKCHGDGRALRPGDARCSDCMTIERDEYLAWAFNRYRSDVDAAMESLGRALLA